MVFDDQIYFGENKYGVLAQIMVSCFKFLEEPTFESETNDPTRGI